MSKFPTPITDAFQVRVTSGTEDRSPLVLLNGQIDYCAAYGEAIEKMAELEMDRQKLLAHLESAMKIFNDFHGWVGSVQGEAMRAAIKKARSE